MTKEEYIKKSDELKAQVNELNERLIEVKNEYIASNQPYPIGSKVRVTYPAWKVRGYVGEETIEPERSECFYVSGYEIHSTHILPILMRIKKDGSMSKVREYIHNTNNIRIEQI